MDGIPTGRYCDGWREVWRATDPSDPQGDGAYVWERVMDRLIDEILDCSIYLYGSHIDARRGEQVGGSGFLYEIPFDEKTTYGRGHLYAVSNWHVVSRAPVIRLNSADDPTGHKIIRLKSSDWIRHPDGQTDIAVAPIADDPATYRYRSIAPGHLVSPERIKEMNIGIGDEAIAIGRFINHDGNQRNQPSVRFGAIAQMPKDKIRTDTGEQDAFLVEIKSISGYSGSPVFALISGRRGAVYKNLLEGIRRHPLAKIAELALEVPELFIFLGIDCGHLLERLPVLDQGNKTGQYVEANTGMAIVVAAWKLAELLETEQLKKQREAARQKRQAGKIAAEDFAEPPKQRTRADNPDDRIDIPIPTRKQFSDDLAKAIRRKRKP